MNVIVAQTNKDAGRFRDEAFVRHVSIYGDAANWWKYRSLVCGEAELYCGGKVDLYFGGRAGLCFCGKADLYFGEIESDSVLGAVL